MADAQLNMKHKDNLIIDIYRNQEIILRIHNFTYDLTAYEEWKIYIEEDGTCTERIRVVRGEKSKAN